MWTRHFFHFNQESDLIQFIKDWLPVGILASAATLSVTLMVLGVWKLVELTSFIAR